MLTRWGEFDRSWDFFDDFRHRMDRLFDEYGASADRGDAAGVWPRATLADGGRELIVTADLPGLSEKDIRLTINQDVLSLAGERKVDAPAGYSVHRQERTPVRFSRSFALPCRVDAEKTQAQVKDGVLTVTLPKVPEAQPRQIAVRAQ